MHLSVRLFFQVTSLGVIPRAYALHTSIHAAPTPAYLQEAGCKVLEDLDVAGVGAGQLLAIPQPHQSHLAGVGLHLAAQVDCVALPCIHGQNPLDLGRIYRGGG